MGEAVSGNAAASLVTHFFNLCNILDDFYNALDSHKASARWVLSQLVNGFLMIHASALTHA
jgi:hypothetical protein